ncbi:hypothetical protein [Tateyamaria sp. SN3-11]
MQILIRIRDDMNLPCALMDIFEAPSPADLTHRLVAKMGDPIKELQ